MHVGHLLELHTWRCLQHAQVLDHLLLHAVDVLARVGILHGHIRRKMERKVRSVVRIIVIVRQIVLDLLGRTAMILPVVLLIALFSR